MVIESTGENSPIEFTDEIIHDYLKVCNVYITKSKKIRRKLNKIKKEIRSTNGNVTYIKE